MSQHTNSRRAKSSATAISLSTLGCPCQSAALALVRPIFHALLAGWQVSISSRAGASVAEAIGTGTGPDRK